MTSDQSRIVKSAALVGVCTVLSRLLGLIRQILMASIFGTSLAQSAFVVAFKIPNLFRAILGEGALTAAFVPVFTQVRQEQGDEQAWEFANRMLTILGLILGTLTLLGILGISIAIELKSYSEKVSLVLSLLRIIWPYLFFICMTAFCSAILNSFHRFFIPALAPVTLNVVWILMLVLLCPYAGVTPEQQIFVVAWAVVVGGLIELVMQLPSIHKLGFRPRAKLTFSDARIYQVVSLMAPVAVGLGIFQINVVVDSLLALSIEAWAPAALSFAELIVHLPISLFAISLGTVLLPTYSKQAVLLHTDEMAMTLSRSMRLLLFLMIPASVGLTMLAYPIAELLYQWHAGKFGAESTVQVGRALTWYATGLVFFGASKIIIPAFYALKDTVTPLRVNVRCVFLNFCLNVIFILTWQWGYKHAGLAFATVLSSMVNCVSLGVILTRRIGYIEWNKVIIVGIKSLLASFISIGIASFVRTELVNYFLKIYQPKAAQLIAFVIAIGLAVVMYGITSAFILPTEFQYLLSITKTRRKTKPH